MEEQKKYGVFRIEKVKLCDGGGTIGRLKHAFREFDNDSFDPELSKKNRNILCDSAAEAMESYKKRIKKITTENYKPQKNAVGLYECLFTSTAGAIPKDREEEFIEQTYKQLCRTFGKDNILAGTVHRDETTVHTHWFITPIFNTTTILRRTREEKKNGTCRTITQPQLNATHWTGSPALMSQLQDIMWAGIFQHFGLERGEVELTAERSKKKKNVRSDIRKRDIVLSQKEKELEQEEQTLAKHRETQNKRDEVFLEQERAFQKEKADYKSEMETALQKAVERYAKLTKSEKFNNAIFPQLPNPESKESVWLYHLRIKSIFDAVVSKARDFYEQIISIKKIHKEEILKLKNDYKTNLEKVKADAEKEKQTAVEKAVLAKETEKDETINSLKKALQSEKSEKEKWYNIVFKKFTIKIEGKPMEIQKGLSDAYLEKSKRLDEWEKRDGDELISLGTSYKKFRVHNWKDYLLAKSRHRTIGHGMSR